MSWATRRSSPAAARLLVAAALCSLCAGAGTWYLRLVTSESVYTDRGTLAWHLLIRAPEIRDLPLLDPTGEPRYHYGCGDGTKPPDQSVAYRSSAPPHEVVEGAVRHFASRGWTERVRGASGASAELASDHGVIRIDATERSGRTEVAVGRWE